MAIFEVLEQLLLCFVGQKAERKLSQRHEVVLPKEVGQGLRDLLGGIDVAVQHPTPELFRRRIDQLDLVSFAKHPIGHPFSNRHAGDLLDRVGDAFEMLDVDGGDDVDARAQKLHDVLPALLVATRTRDIGVGQLVDQRHLGVPLENGVQIHLLEVRSPVFDRSSRNYLEVSNEVFGVSSAVSIPRSR